MNFLLQGREPKERISLLLNLTRISSHAIIDAIHDHLCAGMSVDDAAVINDVQLSNLSRSLKALNDVACIVEQIKEIDWAAFKSVK